MLGLLLIGCGGAATSTPTQTDAAFSTPVSNALASTADKASSSPMTGSARDALPAEVIAFRKRRDQCDHFRGEEASDDARAAELEKALERTCRGTDAELADLRQRYRGNAAVIAALRNYEDQVE